MKCTETWQDRLFNILSLSFCLMAAMLPSPVLSESSDAFPWSNNDETGSISLGAIAPGSSSSAGGIAQGNVGPTQSGPGPVGLFTPNGPGNAAAYNAQLNGALEGSPIVDGTGANIQVTVPMATPSRTPGYLRYTVGATTNDTIQPEMRYQIDTTNPSASPGFVPSSFGTVTNIFSGSSPNPRATPEMTAPGLKGNNSTLGQNSLNADNRTAIQAAAQLSARSANNLTNPSPHAIPTMQRYRRTPASWALASQTPAATYSSTSRTQLQTRAKLADPMAMLGQVNGSIRYDDNQLVLFGAHGTLTVGGNKTATLLMNDGRKLSFHDESRSIRRLAEAHEIAL